MPSPNPIEERLMQLHALAALQQQPADPTVGMLKELYGIQHEQDQSPAQLALLQAHANYYQNLGEDRPEERQARAMQLELAGLDKAYGADPQNPEYHAGRRTILQKYGYNLEGPASAQPAGPLGGGDVTNPLGKDQTSHDFFHFKDTIGALGNDYTGARNAIGMPIYNWLSGLVGSAPSQPRPQPQGFNFWDWNPKTQPTPPTVAQ